MSYTNESSIPPFYTSVIDGHLWAEDEDEDEDGNRYEVGALWMYLYERHDDYHITFDGDRIKCWVISFFLPAWHAKYPGTPPILVLDNCPSHIVGMISPLTMPNKTVCTDAIRDVVISIGCRKWNVVVKRDGVEYVFPLPKRGEEFERASLGLLWMSCGRRCCGCSRRTAQNV